LEGTDRLTTDSYAFIAGPRTLAEPIPSWDLEDVVVYPTADIVATLLGIPGVKEISGADRHWRGWAAAWESGERLIVLEDLEELDDGEGHFGVISLRCDCLVSDLLGLWDSLQRSHPGVWLYGPDCWLQTRSSFLAL
jgi:hypothetical protein